MTTFADPSTFPSLFTVPDHIPVPAPDAHAPASMPSVAVNSATRIETTPSVANGDEATGTAAAAGFETLGLPRKLVRALAKEGISTPFEIQAATVPDALAGRDILGRGQTGSGKTLAFGLPLLARLAEGPAAAPRHPRALVLVPTRELAMQVADALRPLARAVGLFLTTAVGGVPYDRQVDALRRGVEIVVATPGRLGDLLDRGVCTLDRVEITVLDEADQMADMGFLPEVTELLAKTPAGGQRLLFSATLDADVDALVERFLTDPVTHSTAPAVATVSTMEHHLLVIPPPDKFRVAASIAARDGRTIMFARTQLGVDRLVTQLAEVGVRAGALHGGKTQRARTRTLAEFREGRTSVLVATDVAARGIHVDGVSLVVHVDPPKDPKDYLHRAGRTARAGEAGAVATLVLPKQRKSILAMLDKAGVAPAELRVRAGDPALTTVTGAREPSGVPVVDEPPARREAGRGGNRAYAGANDRPARMGPRPGYDERRPRYGDRRPGPSFADRHPRRSFEDSRPRRSFEDSHSRRSFEDSPRAGYDREARPGRDRSGDRPWYGDRAAGPARDERRFGGTGPGDRPGYGDRAHGERHAPADRRGYAERQGAGDRHGYADRPQRHSDRWSDRSGDRRFTERRPMRSY